MDRKTYRFMRYWSDPFYDFHLDLHGIDVMDVVTIDPDSKSKRKGKGGY